MSIRARKVGSSGAVFLPNPREERMLVASSAAVTHRNLETLDLVIIGIYFAIVFGIGFYFSRKERCASPKFCAH